MWDGLDSPAVFYQRHPSFLLPSLCLCPRTQPLSLFLTDTSTTTGGAMADTASSSYVPPTLGGRRSLRLTFHAQKQSGNRTKESANHKCVSIAATDRPIRCSPRLPPVLSASGLPRRNLFRLPDPFVVVSVDGVEKFASTTVRKSLNPFWNEHFDV